MVIVDNIQPMIYKKQITDYYISSKGYVINNKGKILRNRKNNKGYLVVDIYINQEKKTVLVHRLVAENFILNPNNLPIVNHIDGNKENVGYYNLEWCTYSYNNIHAIRHRLRIPLSCEEHQNATIDNQTVHKICKMLQSGLLYDDIINKLNLQNIDNIRVKIKMIKTRNSYTNISKYYIFPEGKNMERKFSDQLIHEICRCFEKGMSREETRMFLNIPKNNSTSKLLYSIYNKIKYKYITDKYNWEIVYKVQRLGKARQPH